MNSSGSMLADWWDRIVYLTIAAAGGIWALVRYFRSDRREKRQEDRSLFLAELARTRQELQDLVPTLESVRQAYTDAVKREAELLEQYRKLNAERAVERRQLLAMIGGLSMQIRQQRKFIQEATGVMLPETINDPMNILIEAEAEAQAQGYRAPVLPQIPKSSDD